MRILLATPLVVLLLATPGLAAIQVTSPKLRAVCSGGGYGGCAYIASVRLSCSSDRTLDKPRLQRVSGDRVRATLPARLNCPRRPRRITIGEYLNGNAHRAVLRLRVARETSNRFTIHFRL